LKNPNYIFYPCESKDISNKEYVDLRNEYKKNPTPLSSNDLKKWPIIGTKFGQKRRNETLNTPQGPQPQAFMRNTITYTAYSWNIYEIASYRASLKADSLRLMETFVDELSVVREDLIKYTNYFEAMDEEFEEEFEAKEKLGTTKNSSSFGGSALKQTATDVAAPLFGLGELFSVFMPSRSSSSSGSHGGSHSHGSDFDEEKRSEAIFKTEMSAIEDMWKVYSIFKKANGFIMY
jgi:hypothetical protein